MDRFVSYVNIKLIASPLTNGPLEETPKVYAPSFGLFFAFSFVYVLSRLTWLCVSCHIFSVFFFNKITEYKVAAAVGALMLLFDVIGILLELLITPCKERCKRNEDQRSCRSEIFFICK